MFSSGRSRGDGAVVEADREEVAQAGEHEHQAGGEDGAVGARAEQLAGAERAHGGVEGQRRQGGEEGELRDAERGVRVAQVAAADRGGDGADQVADDDRPARREEQAEHQRRRRHAHRRRACGARATAIGQRSVMKKSAARPHTGSAYRRRHHRQRQQHLDPQRDRRHHEHASRRAAAAPSGRTADRPAPRPRRAWTARTPTDVTRLTELLVGRVLRHSHERFRRARHSVVTV